MRIYTCTPVAFGGGSDFFARDSGLLCRGFQALGHESQSVMPGKRMNDDEPDLIRTNFENLESAEWWRTHHLDGVVLYAWGRPKFGKVAKAIHKAEIFLVLNQDNGGLVSPLAGFRDWIAEQWILTDQGRSLYAWLLFIKLVVRGLTAGLLLTDPLRAAHLKHGDVIACVSPKAANYYQKLCIIYGGNNLADRVKVIPHAVENRFHFTGGQKHRQIVCVGRWQDSVQKRPWLMMKVIESLMATDHETSVIIAGTITPELEKWHRSLNKGQQNRTHLRGHVSRVELAKILHESQIFYSPSAYESFGIAAAESLCAGCSVVAGRSISMASFEWFVSENSGQLADIDDSRGHLKALQNELNLWQNKIRNPQQISDLWTKRLHENHVANLIHSLKRN